MRTREHYDAELAALHHQLNDLGGLASTAIGRAIEALGRQDPAAARQVVEDDALIDRAQHLLEEHAVGLIALQQPVARDLRRILATIAIGNELERIADYAKGISKLVVGAEGAPQLEAPAELLRLGAMAHACLDHALAAVADHSEAAARALAREDDQIDRLYKELKARLAGDLGSSPAPARAADLLFVAYHFERIADRATNIAERVVYWASAEVVALNP
ncbi:MAG TPA: phosphate signaling complex protein PhoU [Chloroflexaceae bacterium]|nr:phosphate signaling complex protein PhoU [Chloroflexaceae bacterium]